MSAAATAAGYLYASGRLRGRGAREQEHHEQRPEEKKSAPQREEIRVAVLPEESKAEESKPRKTPKIEYRTRRRFTPA
ncbi:MAG TPA: hypothetical protein VFZ54_04365 [Burkholderiales bacterium]